MIPTEVASNVEMCKRQTTSLGLAALSQTLLPIHKEGSGHLMNCAGMTETVYAGCRVLFLGRVGAALSVRKALTALLQRLLGRSMTAGLATELETFTELDKRVPTK